MEIYSMNKTTAQLKAVAMILNGVALLADIQYANAREDEQDEAIGEIKDLVGHIFGVKPEGEPADNKGEQPAQPEASVGEDATTGAPVAEASVGSAVAESAPVSPLDQVLALLNDERYKLRSASSIEEKTGLDADQVEDLLYENDIDYVTRHKTSDGSLLFGLASRN
jgi:hypothetical protein